MRFVICFLLLYHWFDFGKCKDFVRFLKLSFDDNKPINRYSWICAPFFFWKITQQIEIDWRRKKKLIKPNGFLRRLKCCLCFFFKFTRWIDQLRIKCQSTIHFHVSVFLFLEHVCVLLLAWNAELIQKFDCIIECDKETLSLFLSHHIALLAQFLFADNSK